MDDLSGQTWGTIIGAVFAGVAAIVAIATLLVQRNDARNQLRDQRLDEKVHALIGLRIMDLMNLTDRARAAVTDAQANADTAQQLTEQARTAAVELQATQRSMQELSDKFNTEAERTIGEIRSARQTVESEVGQAEEARGRINEIEIEGRVWNLLTELRAAGRVSMISRRDPNAPGDFLVRLGGEHRILIEVKRLPDHANPSIARLVFDQMAAYVAQRPPGHVEAIIIVNRELFASELQQLQQYVSRGVMISAVTVEAFEEYLRERFGGNEPLANDMT